MSAELASAVALLRALANPARLRIALHLLTGEKGVSDMESELGLRQPNLSQYLAELRQAGLVATRREARNVYYSLADERAEALLAALSGQPRDTRPAPPRTSGRAVPYHPVAAASFAVIGSEQ
jgi:DNA-binding transcriptional ArsR family regulator